MIFGLPAEISKTTPKMASRSLPGRHVGMTPPARLCVPMLCRGLRELVCLFSFAVVLGRREGGEKTGTRQPENGLKNSENQGPGGPKSGQNGLRRPLGRLLGPKRRGFKSRCCILSHFGPPRGGSGRPLGVSWAAFGPSWRAFGRSRGRFWASPGRSRGRPGGKLEKEAVRRPFLAHFVKNNVFSCVFGASPAVLFCSVVGSLSGCFFLLPFVSFCCARKGRTRAKYCKTQ